MADQAEKLRQMISADAPQPVAIAPGPPIIVVTGGKGGVGTTTVTMNLGAALANSGRRVVLVDASRHHGDLMQLAGMPFCGGHTLTDVLAGRVSAVDALVPGPAGTLLLGDRWGTRSHADYSRPAQQRLIIELQSLRTDTDVIVLDAGSGHSQWTERFWQQAQSIILPTTTDDVAVMDTYATIKLSASVASGANLRVLINQCDSHRLAADVEHRLTLACQRFLGREIRALPVLPIQTTTDGDELDGKPPRVWESPDSPFGHATLWLGRAVDDLIVSCGPDMQASAEDLSSKFHLVSSRS